MRCNHTPLPHRFPHLHFNPRPRTGCDQPQKLWLVVAPISTHAPAQGATAKSSWPLHKSKFQPTPPHRVRQQTCIKANTYFPPYYIFCTDPCQSSHNFFCHPSSSSIFSLFCQCRPAGKSLCACHSHCLERRALLSVFSKRPLPAKARVGGGSGATKMPLCLGRQKAAPALSSASRRP